MKMKGIKKLTAVSAFALALGALVVTTEAAAEIRQVDGRLWQASSLAEKRAYLAGVANTLSAIHALQVKRGAADPQGPGSRMLAAMDAGTIDSAVAKIDTWYGADSSRLKTPVLGVVWLGLVKAAR